jgi:hypothetical protein
LVVVVVGLVVGGGGGSGAVAAVVAVAMVVLVVGVYVMVVAVAAAAAAVVVVMVASARIDPMCSPRDVVGRQCRLVILIRLIRLVTRCLKVEWAVSLVSLVYFLFLGRKRESVSRFRSVIGSGSISRHAHFLPFRKRSEWCRAQTHFLMNCHNALRRRDGVYKDIRVREGGATQLHDSKI